MDQRTEYIFQILDKIGGPLVAAIAHVSSSSDSQDLNPEVSAREEAQTIAQLLARSVQASIEIGRVMGLDMTNPETADRQRLALMVLAGPLIAGQYRHDGRVPGDVEQKKIMTGLEAVLTFSQNFSPTAANTAELAGSAEGAQGTDIIRAMRHLTPVVNAIGAFPFGQPEKKLIQDVSARITAKADELVQTLVPGSTGSEDRLLLVKTLAEIYAECHAEEMRLMLSRSQDEGDVQQGLDNVWIRFNVRAAMLEALAAGLVPQGTPAPEVKEEVQAVVSAAPPPPPIFTPPAAPVETPAPAAPPAGFNPMSMFGKKDDAPAVADVPPASPPAPPSAPPAIVETPPPPPPEEPKNEGGESETDSSGEGDKGGGGGSSPMSFFKK